jgi:hypothetical protein
VSFTGAEATCGAPKISRVPTPRWLLSPWVAGRPGTTRTRRCTRTTADTSTASTTCECAGRFCLRRLLAPSGKHDSTRGLLVRLPHFRWFSRLHILPGRPCVLATYSSSALSPRAAGVRACERDEFATKTKGTKTTTKSSCAPSTSTDCPLRRTNTHHTKPHTQQCPDSTADAARVLVYGAIRCGTPLLTRAKIAFCDAQVHDQPAVVQLREQHCFGPRVLGGRPGVAHEPDFPLRYDQATNQQSKMCPTNRCLPVQTWLPSDVTVRATESMNGMYVHTCVCMHARMCGMFLECVRVVLVHVLTQVRRFHSPTATSAPWRRASARKCSSRTAS